MFLGITDQVILIIIPEAVIGAVRVNFAAIPEDFPSTGIVFRVLKTDLSLLLYCRVKSINRVIDPGLRRFDSLADRNTRLQILLMPYARL